MILDEWEYEILINKLNETSDYSYSSTNFGNYIERGDIVVLLDNDFGIFTLECDDSTALVKKLTDFRIGSTFMLFNGQCTIIIGKITS